MYKLLKANLFQFFDLHKSVPFLSLGHVFKSLDFVYQGLMTALQKQTTVTSFVDLQRWLAVVCVVLELMGSLFTEKSLPAIR